MFTRCRFQKIFFPRLLTQTITWLPLDNWMFITVIKNVNKEDTQDARTEDNIYSRVDT